MPEYSELSFFIVASLLLIIAPGPDIIFLITKSLNDGPIAGLITALGLACGNLVHTIAAVLGVSALFQSSQLAFDALKIAGVCYLLFLAYEAISERNSATISTESNTTQSSLFMRGVLMNVLNPKVALFFLAFLPQFVNSNAPQVWAQMVFYGVTFTLLVVIVFGSVGLFVGMVSSTIAFIKPGKFRWFRWITAAVFITLAMRLFFVER